MHVSAVEAMILRRWRQLPAGAKLMLTKGEGNSIEGMTISDPRALERERAFMRKYAENQTDRRAVGRASLRT